MTGSFIKNISISTYKQSSLIFFPHKFHIEHTEPLYGKRIPFYLVHTTTQKSAPRGNWFLVQISGRFQTTHTQRSSVLPEREIQEPKNRTAAAAPGTASNFYLRGAASNGSHQKTKVLSSERKPGDTAGINNSIFCNVTAGSQVPPWSHQEHPPPPHLLHHSGSGSSCSHHPKKWPTT